MNSLNSYFGEIYSLRYFWTHLIKIELKNKFRRSKLGIIWCVANPLFLSIIMGVVFSVAFHYEIMTYMPYVLSGILFWDIVSNTFVNGSYSIINNESFIRQCNHPLAIYTLKSACVSVVTFLIAMISLLIWIVISCPSNLIVGVFSLPLTLLLFFFFSWGGITISGYTCIKYRDYPMLVPLVLQVIWYVSPVFLSEDLFTKNALLFKWFQINPITHMLNMIRAPFLHGVFPTVTDYAISVCFILFIDVVAILISRRQEKNIIFYL